MRQQAWGVAFRDKDGIMRWGDDEGPHGWRYQTKRAAVYTAFRLNFCEQGGSFVPVPVPNYLAMQDQDLEPYYDVMETVAAGSFGKERAALLKLAHDRLMSNPDLNLEDLQHLPLGT